jgi:hypothetical protein
MGFSARPLAMTLHGDRGRISRGGTPIPNRPWRQAAQSVIREWAAPHPTIGTPAERFTRAEGRNAEHGAASIAPRATRDSTPPPTSGNS